MASKHRTYHSNEELIGIERFHNLRKRFPLVDNFTPISEVPSAWLQFIEPKIKRFPAEDPKGGCWIWQGAVDKDGHPVMMTTDLKGKRGQRRVARWIAAFFYDFATEVAEVSHHCRNITCVRPSDLELHLNDDHHYIYTLISRDLRNKISKIRPGIDDRRKTNQSSTGNIKADQGHITDDTTRPNKSWVSVAEAIINRYVSI